jgi:dynein heavy chain
VRAPKQAPPQFEREEVRERLRRLPGGPAQPLTVHLRQEIDRLNTTIALTISTLQNLRLAIAGALRCCSCLPVDAYVHWC